MEIVLLEDVKALGKKGQVVKVNDGYDLQELKRFKASESK